MNIAAEFWHTKKLLTSRLKVVKFNDVVNIMSNHSRNQWAKAGYPGLQRKELEGPAEFISPPLLLMKLQEATQKRMAELLQPKRKI